MEVDRRRFLREPLFRGPGRITLTVPADLNATRPKLMLDCALWELDIVDQDYGTRADTMLQHQGFVRALNGQARLRGFEANDTVRKLYGAS